MDIFRLILAQIFRHDPGNRGLTFAPIPDLDDLTTELAESQRVLVLTGFSILDARIGESDGPPGAACIARALCALGKQVCIVTDPFSADIVRVACGIYAPAAEICCIPPESPQQACQDLLESFRPTHIISIERPGKSGGSYHNMRGLVLDGLVSDTDSLFSSFDGVKIAIGDGGNELGMGSLRELVVQSVPNGSQVVADLGCDFPLVAGVSNWWGWGIAALLSVHTGRDLLPSDEEETVLLKAITEAGAVDGTSGKPQMTVDGLSLEENLQILRQIRSLTRNALESLVRA